MKTGISRNSSAGYLRARLTRRFRLIAVGLDGFAMLLASLVVMAASGGLLYLWCLRRVVVVARRTPADTGSQQGWLVVPGVCLGRGGDVPADFQMRLARTLAAGSAPILLLGGRTSAHDPRSEAEAGAAWLLAHGVDPARLHREDASRNTLENLRGVRERIGEGTPPMLITNRYHLARTGLLAAGLKLDHRLCSAENTLKWTPPVVGKVMLEAFFIHWYLVGRAVARVLRHRGMLARIT